MLKLESSRVWSLHSSVSLATNFEEFAILNYLAAAPLPRFDPIPGQSAPPQPPALQSAQVLTPSSTGTPSSPSSGAPPVRVPALSPERVNEYSGLFEKSGAENGFLSGLVAKQIFERARLPNEVLGKIWGLADTQGRGALDVTEFVIAMHLLASYKSGAMRGVPNTLPPGLLDAASRRSRLSGGMPPGRPTSSAGPPPLQQQFSGVQPNLRAASPIVNRPLSAAPLGQQGTGEPWLIDGADKARFDQIFGTIDTTGQGFISGEQAVQFFGNARLPEEVLAQIWDLADINSDGVLNRDEFAVAMFLIKQRRASRDGRVPDVLPTALIPPSMRKQQQPSQPATMPAFEDAPVTKPRSNIDDLFGLDVNEAPPPQQQQVAPQISQSTGGTDAGPFAAPKAAFSPTAAPASSVFKPFVPSSSFGQGLMPQPTGSPAPAQNKEASLMDDEDDTPKRIDNDAAELGNLSNQIGNLSTNMQGLSTQRAQAEQQIAQNSQQKQAFQQRLTQLRAAYESEVAQVKALKDELAASQADTKRIQQDMAMIEGTHADLSTQRQQLATALAADQQENAALKEKIRQTNAENEQLKPQLEKLKSDARQQKGLVAINKKQLATNEGERDRIRAEIAAAQHELEVSRKEAEETARQLEQSQRELEHAKAQPMPAPVSRELEQAKAQPLPAPISRELSPPPQVVSPTPSTSSNPFFRRQDSGAVFSPPMGSTIHSPVPQYEHERNSAFDAIFGPSLGASAPAPTTSFGRETPEAKGIATPDTPKVIEPPAPPVDTQINSSALPIRNPLLREDSVSSSVKVAPPASRLSPAHTPRALTPDTSTSSPVSQRADNPFALSAADEEQESVRQSLPRGETLEKVETLPGAFPGSRSESPAVNNVNPTAVAIGAGAATLAAGAGLAAAVDSQTKETQPPADTKDNFDDFFGGPSHKKTLSEQHADFDSAFASMDTKGKQPSNNQRSANHEFPDIQELDDDESSSDDDSDPRGFDDNFAPMSSKAAGKQPETARAAETAAAPSLAPPPIATNLSSASLPRIDSQQSPPTYNEAVPADNPNHFPMEYKNLLPEREDPTSPPPTAGGSTQTGPSPAGEPPSYGPEVGSPPQSRSASQVHATAAPPTQAAPFDFDSAFTNLGEAPVADDSDSDYNDATPVREKNHPVEFDTAFDSPAPSTRTVNSAQQPVSIYAAVTAAPGPTTNGTSSTSPTGPAQAGFASFDDFNSNPFPPSRSGTQQSEAQPSQIVAAPSTSSNANTSHDWDDLFASLDSQPKAAPQDSNIGAPLTQTTTNSAQQATEIGSGLAAVTSQEEVRDLTPPASSSNVPQLPTAIAAPTSAPSSSLKPGRPAPGRALSTGTEHDDPILKRLTAMGWKREEALTALEKFDYNIDKVCLFNLLKNL